MASTRTVRVVNDAGLHARPCHAIVQTALEYSCELRIRSIVGRGASSGGGAPTGSDVNGKSILELMTLEAGKGSELELAVDGDGEAELLESLAALFERGFGEP